LSIPTCILTPGGISPTPYTAESLADAALKEPLGVYTTARTYRRDHTLLLDDHLDRLEQSAALVGLPVTLDRLALRGALRTLVESVDYADSRFRITIPQAASDTLILSIEPYTPVPPDVLAHGSVCATLPMERHNPTAKTTAWMIERKPAMDSLPPGTYEGLLVSPDGVLTEGASSNFYAVMHDTLRTADEGVLHGIAQRIVLSVVTDVLPVELAPITISDLPFIDEAFITSSGRGVVPVIMIDKQVISTGQPGPHTLEIQARYNAWADAHLEPL
jgi:branched-chain amino acid aminotransferase